MGQGVYFFFLALSRYGTQVIDTPICQELIGLHFKFVLDELSFASLVNQLDVELLAVDFGFGL